MTRDSFRFTPSPQRYSLGVEVEMQLVDMHDFGLASRGRQMLMRVPDRFSDRIKGELYQCMFEVASDVCKDADELAANLDELFRRAEVLARECGCLVFAASLHPQSPWREQQTTPSERYQRLMDELRRSGRRLITQGLHVHVGVGSGDDAVRICDAIRPHLPTLLALSASSPFYGGEDSGFDSYRALLLEDLPRSGLPATLKDWKHCAALLGVLKKAGQIETVREIWWDVRPQPGLGTVEVRVCDVPMRFSEIIGIAALVQALVATIDRSDREQPFPGMEVVRANKWAAARHGMAARFIDPADPARTVGAADAAGRLFSLVHDAARQLGGTSHIGALRRIVSQGNGASRMRALLRKHPEPAAAIRELLGEFWT